MEGRGKGHTIPRDIKEGSTLLKSSRPYKNTTRFISVLEHASSGHVQSYGHFLRLVPHRDHVNSHAITELSLHNAHTIHTLKSSLQTRQCTHNIWAGSQFDYKSVLFVYQPISRDSNQLVRRNLFSYFSKGRESEYKSRKNGSIIYGKALFIKHRTLPSNGTNAGRVAATLTASCSCVIKVSGTIVSSSGTRSIVMASAMTSATCQRRGKENDFKRSLKL